MRKGNGPASLCELVWLETVCFGFTGDRNSQAARPYWFELIPADKMSYEDGPSNTKDWSASHSLRTSTNRAFCTHEIQPRLRLGQSPEDLFHLVEVPQITTLPLDLHVLNASLGRGVLDTLDGLVSLVLLSVDHDHSAVSEGEGEGDFFTDSFGSSGDDGGLRTLTRQDVSYIEIKARIKGATLLTLPDKSPSSGLAGPIMGSSTACIVGCSVFVSVWDYVK